MVSAMLLTPLPGAAGQRARCSWRMRKKGRPPWVTSCRSYRVARTCLHARFLVLAPLSHGPDHTVPVADHFGVQRPGPRYRVRHSARGIPASVGPHGKPHQLWYMRPSGHKEEVHIVSAANSLSLDAGRGMGEGHQPQMWAQSDVAWKRWRLTPSPDGRTHQLSCEGTGTVLDSPWDAKAGTRPVMWNGHDGENQQWVLALPFGKASADAAR
ncbi:RICIN domain-containing protein [Streptomyces sp. NPDC001102]